MSASLSVIAACSTPPSLAPPDVCFERCTVNTCTLPPEYEKKPDEARAVDELLCVKMNADSAAYCAELNLKCAGELRRRQAPGTTAR